MPVFYEPDPPPFIEGAIVRLRGTRLEMTVDWHAGGTVHCHWVEDGDRVEGNFNASKLEPVK